MHKNPIRVALLGAGERGRHVINYWLRFVHCEVVAVVDPSPAALDKAKQFFGDKAAKAEFTSDLTSWLARADADVVTINSWDNHHAQNAIDCLEAGLNIQVAKPMCQSIEEADRLVAAWRRSGRIGIVDMQIRTCPLIQEAKRLIDEGAVGKVRLVTCLDSVGMGACFYRASRYRRKDQVRSLTLAKGVHFLDICNLFMGDDPVRVFASGGLDHFGGDKPDDLKCRACDERGTCPENGDKALIGGMPFPFPDSLCVFARETNVYDNAIATIDYKGGGRCSYVECQFTPEYQTTYEVIGDRGAIFVRYAMDERLFLEYRPRDSARVERANFYPQGVAHGGGEKSMSLLIEDAIRNNRQVHPDILDGRNAVALCEAIDRSVETRIPVDIPPPPPAEPSAGRGSRERSARAPSAAVGPPSRGAPGMRRA
ncbi:MAG: Gfo/Idh/MocA family oxidoreductase [Verrucomicrobiae bacterium]|nr:Gfo/Idh/MocA family oxidoreductase [Verrucomicrobiae bacterium]